MKEVIVTTNAPTATGPFSQAVVSGDLVYTSGQINLTPDGRILEGSVQDRADQVMQNLKAVLAEAGVTFDDVIKVTVYLADMAEYKEFNEVYGNYVKYPCPAREIVGGVALPLKATIEVSMIARKPG